MPIVNVRSVCKSTLTPQMRRRNFNATNYCELLHSKKPDFHQVRATPQTELNKQPNFTRSEAFFQPIAIYMGIKDPPNQKNCKNKEIHK